MAAPIAHLFLALQVLSGPLKDKFDEKEFLIGTSFPDIRYLNVVSRDNTHYSNVSFEQIKKETNAFKAGMLFHSLVDEQREKYIVDKNIYSKLPKFRFVTQSLKFAEDQILLSLFNPKPYCSYFVDISQNERNFGIDDISIKKWHEFLKLYFSNDISMSEILKQYFNLNMPNASFIKRFLFSFYFSREIEKTINKIVNDNSLRSILLNFYANFTNNLEK